MNQNNYQGAIRNFKEASFIDPNWVLPYVQQGYLYLQMRDYVKLSGKVSPQCNFIGLSLYNSPF